MSDTKILQSILDGQKEIKDAVLENRKRIDKIGLDLAQLSDDAPTIKEFDDLEKRVSKLENQIVN